MECSTETNTTATTTTTTTTTTSATCRSGSQSPSSSSSPPSTPNPNPNPNPSPSLSLSPPVVISPCAACKILRRRCADKCVLAPYFPPTDPAKFTIAHRVFGASNIIKFLQELPESQRADAVSSMVYEASARIRDPVYGCAGAICQLQKQVSELQAQLAKAQAEVVNMQCQQANLMALICMDLAQSQQVYYDSPLNHHINPQPQQQQQQQQALDGSIFNNMITTTPSLMITNNQSNNGLSFLEDNNNILGSMWEPLWT